MKKKKSVDYNDPELLKIYKTPERAKERLERLDKLSKDNKKVNVRKGQKRSERIANAKSIMVEPIMTDKEADEMSGRLLAKEDCKRLIDFDCDVYDKVTGICIAKFRRNVIHPAIQKAAYDNLLAAATPTDNRGVATEKKDGYAKHNKVLKNGKIDKVNRAHKLINSGIVGYYERSQRFPYCRLTAFTQNHMDKFRAAYPMIKIVDMYYSKLMPDHYNAQKKMVEKTPKDFVIPKTVFTTITVNKNWQTAVHKDAGDFKGGFGNLVALRKGKYIGGYLVLVKWGVGFDLQNGDLLLMDVHQWHGNTPMVGDPGFHRLSLVMYYREKMVHCEEKEKELQRVKKRKKGTPLI